MDDVEESARWRWGRTFQVGAQVQRLQRLEQAQDVQGASGRPAGLGPRPRGQREGCRRGAGAQPAGLPCRPGQGAGV